MVADVKALLRILPVFCVLPIFWTLFDQQGSVWTLQVILVPTGRCGGASVEQTMREVWPCVPAWCCFWSKGPSTAIYRCIYSTSQRDLAVRLDVYI
jgi:hypothetical protein